MRAGPRSSRSAEATAKAWVDAQLTLQNGSGA
jgi:hypothetical protein